MSASELLDYILGLLPVLRHVAAYEGLLDLRQLVEEGLARGDDEAARVKVRASPVTGQRGRETEG